MALGAGHLARCGIGLESLSGTYPTLVAPTILLPFITEGLNPERTYQQNKALTDKLGQESPTITGKRITGSLQVYASYRNSEYLLMNALRGTVVKSGAESPYTHTFDLGEIHRAMSIIIEKDVNCWDIEGGVINTLELNSSPEGVYWNMGIMAMLDGLSTTHRAALAALTYTESDPRLFHHNAVLRIADTVNALAAGDVIAVSEFSLAFDNKLTNEPQTTTSALYFPEPKRNGKPELTLSFTDPRYTADTLPAAYHAGTKMQADIIFTGAVVGAGTYSMQINLPTLIITSCPTPVSGEEIIPLAVTAQCVRNDGNANMAETNQMELILKNAGDTELAWTV